MLGVREKTRERADIPLRTQTQTHSWASFIYAVRMHGVLFSPFVCSSANPFWCSYAANLVMWRVPVLQQYRCCCYRSSLRVRIFASATFGSRLGQCCCYCKRVLTIRTHICSSHTNKFNPYYKLAGGTTPIWDENKRFVRQFEWLVRVWCVYEVRMCRCESKLREVIAKNRNDMVVLEMELFFLSFFRFYLRFCAYHIFFCMWITCIFFPTWLSCFGIAFIRAYSYALRPFVAGGKRCSDYYFCIPNAIM